MALPEFNSQGELPEGLHRATLAEVMQVFGSGSQERKERAALLLRIYAEAMSTGKLQRFVVFGSFITSKIAPRDVDVVLVMDDDFLLTNLDEATRMLFDHERAENQLGASIFWLTPRVVLRGTLEEFLVGWGTKRDRSRRGIVEIVS